MGVKTVSFFVTWAVVLASGMAKTTEDDREFRETNLPSLPPSIEGKHIEVFLIFSVELIKVSNLDLKSHESKGIARHFLRVIS